jgi:SAM-dependent methyltransferase
MSRSRHADHYLVNLKGLEIGGSFHNQFDLDTLNVDFIDNQDYKQMEMDASGNTLPVDIIANAWEIPVEDKSFDFVISSHVIEHIWDPIGALLEWKRIARKYIYVICPQRDASPFDAPLPLTTLQEIIERHEEGQRPGNLGHVSIWTCQLFMEMLLFFDFKVIDYRDPDDKVGNGFAVVIDVSE